MLNWPIGPKMKYYLSNTMKSTSIFIRVFSSVEAFFRPLSRRVVKIKCAEKKVIGSVFTN